jgi:hypothetical protein
MKLGWRPRKWLDKKSKQGFRGYPVGTIAFYRPDAQRASKVAVAVIVAPDTEPVALRRWFAESGDVRNDAATFEEIALFLRDHEGHSVAMTRGMMGCPHEEGIRRGLSGLPVLGWWRPSDWRVAGLLGARATGFS